MTSFPTIRVFQDLSIVVEGDSTALRNTLIAGAKDCWHHDTEVESRVAAIGMESEKVLLAFRRDGDDTIPAAVVTLYPEGTSGFKVTNIVPSETYSLTHLQYNMILNDFVAKVVRVAAPDCQILLSKDHEGLTDWTSDEAATALVSFSRAANKSTGSSHPRDKERWLAFIVEHHKSHHKKLDAHMLARWLHEAEKWPEENAHELAIEFESAIELLTFYDENL
ncbi:hypothetical protein [Herbaspirillum sp. NPDC087042]|uniref:hypothetical protein n=1 Tax=Herbaspirillum sp. NPDC087042 TaxID=3364004 RepID=UPI00381682AC